MSPVLEFLLGLLIVLFASLLNALGLTLTRKDHIQNAAIPKGARRSDWLRPLWLIGMLLYIVSQLIGSTLALQYMRAEYVAPLGSCSLIFNFVFARILIGTQITRNDILGTVVIIVSVAGIILFGSWNSGLEDHIDLARLVTLWSRLGWLVYFIIYSLAVILVFLSATQLDTILAARGDLESVPFAAEASRSTRAATTWWLRTKALVTRWGAFLEHWTAAQGDRHLAWTLGIMWSVCGGALAGECLVFAKAAVKLVSGKLSHENGGNQFAHPAAIFTFIFLACTAVSQIVALNRGLRAYDSTLVVPMFYGVYTAAGFVNSLIFNDETEAYKGWVLALIFLAILCLIGGVVLLTHEKPDPAAAAGQSLKLKQLRRGSDDSEIDKERLGKEGKPLTQADLEQGQQEGRAAWELGGDSDDEDDSAPKPSGSGSKPADASAALTVPQNGERAGLMSPREDEDEEDHHHQQQPTTSKPRRRQSADDDEFGDWEDGSRFDADGVPTRR